MAGTTVRVLFKSSFVKKTKGNERILKRKAKQAASDLAEQGRVHARSIAPSDTGLLISLIKTQQIKGGQFSGSFEIVSLNPVEHGGDGYRRDGATASTVDKYNTNGVFDLVKWAHTSNYAPSHFRGGEARYMFKTRGYVMKKRNELVRSGYFKKGLIK